MNTLLDKYPSLNTKECCQDRLNQGHKMVVLVEWIEGALWEHGVESEELAVSAVYQAAAGGCRFVGCYSVDDNGKTGTEIVIKRITLQVQNNEADTVFTIKEQIDE